MSSHPNHRRMQTRTQDNGPTWEGGAPCSGCNSTHVARGRSKWKKYRHRAERRTKGPAKKFQYWGSNPRRVQGHAEDRFEALVEAVGELPKTVLASGVLRYGVGMTEFPHSTDPTIQAAIDFHASFPVTAPGLLDSDGEKRVRLLFEKYREFVTCINAYVHMRARIDPEWAAGKKFDACRDFVQIDPRTMFDNSRVMIEWGEGGPFGDEAFEQEFLISDLWHPDIERKITDDVKARQFAERMVQAAKQEEYAKEVERSERAQLAALKAKYEKFGI